MVGTPNVPRQKHAKSLLDSGRKGRIQCSLPFVCHRSTTGSHCENSGFTAKIAKCEIDTDMAPRGTEPKVNPIKEHPVGKKEPTKNRRPAVMPKY